LQLINIIIIIIIIIIPPDFLCSLKLIYTILIMLQTVLRQL